MLIKAISKVCFVSFLGLSTAQGLSTSVFAIEEFHGALGLGSSLNSRQLSPTYNFTQVAPELVGLSYVHLKNSFWLRPAIRLSYSWNQPPMARAVHMSETDWKGLAELGVVWSWVVVPSVSIGAGSILRTTSLEATDQVLVRDSKIGGTSFLPLLQAQLGVGIPIEKGRFLVEPYIRYLHIFDDSRYRWASGVEATVSVF